MKDDISRNSFKKPRHYSRVRLQQGRVQMDADWNEQQDIIVYQANTKMQDVVGPAGGPVGADGFELATAFGDYSSDVQGREINQDPPALVPGDIYISGGRYYVDGILVENERLTSYFEQPHFFGNEISTAGVYAAYLDVWERHVTALEDPSIREVALGGPDTATRSQTLWQLRLVRVANQGTELHCNDAATSYEEATAAMTGVLAARAEPGEDADSPCLVPSDAGYRRLENQLYRVEVHQSGNRGRATFKWSRDNGSVVARWESSNDDQITVSQAGRDKYLSFAPGQWVELIDEERVLRHEPGTLVRLVAVVDRVLTLDTATADGPYDLASFGTNPKVRRWDSDGVMTPTNMNWLDLEDGVQISVRAGSFRCGDYWLIPARTNTHTIEWPREEGSENPAYRLPEDIQHHYCRIGVLNYDGSAWTSIEDCRRLFPPLTELISLKYLGGDGQEAMPDTADPSALIPLAAPLRVGVENGALPLANATIVFEIEAGNGALIGGGTSATVLTNAEGVAQCQWSLDGVTPNQRVSARLVEFNTDIEKSRLEFNANLSRAAAVSYQPGACEALQEVYTVQSAIDRLCELFHRCTTYVVRPGDDLAAIFESLEPDENASICFARGDYIIEEPILITGKGHLKIAGCGLATRLLAPNSEAGLVFNRCRSVLLSDFYGEAGAVGNERLDNSLQGPITVLDTGWVVARHLHLRCGDGDSNAATCLTVRRTLATEDGISTDSVIISDCLFSIGHSQTGLLVVNASRAMITSNGFNTQRQARDEEGDPIGFKGIVVAGHFLEHCTVAKNTLFHVGEGIRVALSDYDENYELTSKVTIEDNVIHTRIVPPRESGDCGIFVGNAMNIVIKNNLVVAQLLQSDRDDPKNPGINLQAMLGIGSEYIQQPRLNRYSLNAGIYIHGLFGAFISICQNEIRFARMGIRAISENKIPSELASALLQWRICENMILFYEEVGICINPHPFFVLDNNREFNP